MARKALDIPGQINLFTYMEEIAEELKKQEEAKNVLTFATKKEEILSKAEEYLQKGERLTSLAKDKYARLVKRLSFTEIEKKLFAVKANKYGTYQLIPKIATTVVRPLLKQLTTCDDADEAYKMIKELVSDYDISLEMVDDEDYAYSYVSAINVCKYKLKAKKGEIISLTIREDGWNPFTVYGHKNYAHTKTYKDKKYMDSSHVADIAELLAWLTCFTLYNKALLNEDLKPAIESKLQEKYPASEAVLKYALVNGSYRLADPFKDCDSAREIYEKYPAPLATPLQKIRSASETAIKELCSYLGYDEDKVLRDEKLSFESLKDRNRLEMKEDRLYLYALTRDLDLAFQYIDPLNWAKTDEGKLKYHDFVWVRHSDNYRTQNDPDAKPKHWAIPGMGLGGIGLHVLGNVDSVLELVFENYKERLTTLDYLRDAEKKAKPYQTKKNIPEKTVKAMQESALNDLFGYVEYDADTDLEKVSVFADQFIAFKETYLGGVDTSSISIRFRKLGNYKAAGLYYPSLGCLCVDFRHPSSLVHEYGHCIDYTVGGEKQLSELSEFYGVYSEYRKNFRRELSISGKKLKGKYNEDYYLQKTEVFARCMEMYVTRTLKVNNSICKPEDEFSFAYPESESMMAKINEYFARLFDELKDKEIAA